MIKNEIEGYGQVLQSHLLNAQPTISHYSSLRESLEPERGVWMPRQVHGVEIIELDEECLAAEVPEADAVITRLKGQWIGVRTADCVPVLLCDTEAGVVAAVHAGWRGTVRHIVRLTLQRMVESFHCRPETILAMVGPSISPNAFEVGEEVADAFVQADRSECVLRSLWGPRGVQRFAKPHVDLWQSNVMDLLEVGVDLQHIDCTPWCTYEHYQQLFSARREGIGTGRIVSAIQIK